MLLLKHCYQKMIINMSLLERLDIIQNSIMRNTHYRSIATTEIIYNTYTKTINKNNQLIIAPILNLIAMRVLFYSDNTN